MRIHLLAAVQLVWSYDNGLGRTPPMGWNSWCTSGASALQPSVCNLLGKDPCSEAQVKGIADAIIANGMDKLGYEYLEVSEGHATRRFASYSFVHVIATLTRSNIMPPAHKPVA